MELITSSMAGVHAGGEQINMCSNPVPLVGRMQRMYEPVR